MEFEFFTSKLWTEKKSPIATILSNSIALNASACQKYQLKRGQLILLGYDNKTNTIGIKLIQKPEDGARKLAGKASSVLAVGATKFLRCFKITQKGRFPLNYDAKRKILYFPLKFSGQI